ncbi:MAG: DedA family protein [Gemmatimonadaceae bacterium]|nr:DedA family protein [Gemmatimonadaceae bacterium]
MMTPVRLLSFAIVAVTAVSVGSWSDLNFIEALADSFWTYALLGLSAIVIEELSPVFGGIAAHEGELQLIRVIVGITLGGWLCTSVLYAAGRVKWDWIRKRFPRFRAAGTVALRVVARNPLTASFLVRFAFGLRIVLPLACGAARVPLATYLAASLLGSALWTLVFALIGYAAGEAAVRAVGHVGRAGEIIGALVVTAAVYAFIRWNRVRRAKKDERKRRKAMSTSET